jgi:aminomethyltransferase
MPKKTPLYDLHVKYGGKIVDFAGFLLPLEFSSIIDEHNVVRNAVGIFDVSHMGDIIIKGKDATEFLEYILPSKVSGLKDFTARYSAYLNDYGILLDDTIVSKINSDTYLLVPNAATAEMIYKWLVEHKKRFAVNISDRTLLYACIAVQGPRATDLVSKITDYNLKSMEMFDVAFVKINGVETRGDDLIPYNHVFLSKTGYTGEDGYEIIVQNEYADEIWEMLLNYGKEYGIKMCGLGARDTLRLEKGMLLSGQDFHNDKTPLEANISWIIDYDHEFIGKEALLEQKGTDYKIFRGFKMLEAGIPRHGYKIYKDNKEIGIITSGTLSPVLKIGIGLGYVPKDIKINDIVMIDIRGTKKKAIVTKPKIVP